MSSLTLQGSSRRRRAATDPATASRLATRPPAPAVAAGGHWLDRLAAWAEAAPPHHRLGRWTVYLR